MLEVFVSLKTTKFIGISLIACLLKSTKIITAQYIETNKPTVIQTLVDLINPLPIFCNLADVPEIQYPIKGLV